MLSDNLYILFDSTTKYNADFSNTTLSEAVKAYYIKKFQHVIILSTSNRLKNLLNLQLKNSQHLHLVFHNNLVDINESLEFINKICPELLMNVYFDIFLYGNSIYKIYKSQLCQQILSTQYVHFYCFSQAQAKQLDLLLIAPTRSIFKLKTTHVQRKKKIANYGKTFTWLYAGRLSYKKNIHTLIRLFVKTLSVDPNQKLILVGEFDNIGSYSHPTFKDGAYQKYIQNFIKKLPEKYKKKITLLSKKSHKVLSSFYTKASVVVNLSTFESDILSLSMLEARYLKKPTLCTQWGGLIENYDSKTYLIKTESQVFNFSVNESDFLKKYAQLRQQKPQKSQLKAPSQKILYKKTNGISEIGYRFSKKLLSQKDYHLLYRNFTLK